MIILLKVVVVIMLFVVVVLPLGSIVAFSLLASTAALVLPAGALAPPYHLTYDIIFIKVVVLTIVFVVVTVVLAYFVVSLVLVSVVLLVMLVGVLAPHYHLKL